MKKFINLFFILTMTLLFYSCIGQFYLTNSLLDWNRNLHCKFVNEVVFVCLWIIPVYEVSIFVDAMVLNTIDFWNGPDITGFGTSKKHSVKGENGENYTIIKETEGYTLINDDKDISIKDDKDISIKLLFNDDEENMVCMDRAGNVKINNFYG